jgi:heterodisulfide reductase subunit A
VVLATGFEEYDASENPLLGYGQLEGVVTTADLDRALRKDNLTSFLPEGGQPFHVAFIQCVGSRDRKSGREYCSQFCCRTTIRLANRLLYLRPETQVTVFYIDLQIMSKDFIAFYRQAQEKIRFIQGVSAEVTQGEERPLRLFSVISGSDKAEPLEFDRVVLAIGLAPTGSHASLARTFDVGLNQFGYLDASVTTAGSGVFPVGGCAGPNDIQGSRRHALAVAARVAELMKPPPAVPGLEQASVTTLTAATA